MARTHSKFVVVLLTMLGSISFVIALVLVIAIPLAGLGIVLGVLH